MSNNTRIIGTCKLEAEDLTTSTGRLRPTLKAVTVTQKAHIYVGRLDPETNAEDVREYLVDNLYSDDITVEKIDSKSGYGCFRVSCDYKLLKDLRNPKLWPAGVVINRFYFKKNFVQHPKVNEPN